MNEEMYEKIDAYLMGEMSQEERRNFEQELEANAELRTEWEKMRHIQTAFEQLGEAQALQELEAMTQEDIDTLTGKKRVVPLPRKLSRWLIPATAIAALFLLTLLFIKPSSSTEELFASYYHREALELLPSRGELAEVNIRRDSLYLLSLDQVEGDKAATAIPALQELSSDPDYEYREEAEWLLALAYVKTNQRENAVKLLEQIIAQGGFYAEQARSLKDNL